MTRVATRSHHGAHRSAGLDRPRAIQQQQKKKKPYKIVLEAVTQEKRKLHSILTYASNAPPGFGFVPAGHPEFTEWCKEQCRQRNLDVHIVSAKPRNKAHADPEKISHHVHRIGHHFPNEIIEIACAKFGYTFDDAHGLRKIRSVTNAENWMAQKMADYNQRMRLHGRPTTEKETKDHIRGAVREMFPKIPDADLTSIVTHAFQEGTNRVGNAKELPLARRVQLAVVAHIRHTYTDYDKILKTGSWTEARQKVEHVSLAKLKEWRDETGEQSNELEDTFREVIVLDDDESSDEDTLSGADEREASMEIISSRATARELQPEETAFLPRMDARDLPRSHRRVIRLPHVPLSYSTLPGPSSCHLPSQLSRVQTRPVAPPAQTEPRHLEHGRSVVPQPTHLPTSASLQMRDADGRLYNLQPIHENREPTRPVEANRHPRVGYDPSFVSASRHAQEGYAQSHHRVNSFELNKRRPILPPSRRASEHEFVLPSIERDPEAISSPRHVSNVPHSRDDRNSVSRGYAKIHSPKRIAHNIDDRYPEQAQKRLKTVYNGDDMYSRSDRAQIDSSRQVRDQELADPYSRSRQQLHEIIDLTSSPRRLPQNGEREVLVPVRPYMTAVSGGHPYVAAPPREVATREPPSRAYDPDDMAFDRRPGPARDYVALREEPPRSRVVGEHEQYLRHGVDYGRHRLH